MKQKGIIIVIGMMLCVGVFGGCGNKEMKQDNVTTGVSEEAKRKVPKTKRS